MKIEKNIPLPGGMEHETTVKQILRQMAVGDSVRLTLRQKDTMKQNAWRDNARGIASRKLTTRKQIDGMFRVWLVSSNVEPPIDPNCEETNADDDLRADNARIAGGLR